MPELAEVQTVLDTLAHQLGNFTIQDIQIFYPALIATSDAETFIQTLRGKTVLQYHRHGKYLMFDLGSHMWIVHLRMEGKFYIYNQQESPARHVHAVFQLEDGRSLHYHDTRKFGRMYVYAKQSDDRYPCFCNTGYDLFDERLNAMDLYRTLKQKQYTLKQALLDQRNLAGIGNIYADEICFAMKLHPKTRVQRLSRRDVETLLQEARRILQEAIEAGGTTIRSYTSSLGVDGRFQLKLKVHGRKGEKCTVCGSEIRKIAVAQRGTYFCASCQKRK